MKSHDLGLLAYQALIEEVSLDYKPGLVCLNSNGSHHDMTIETFKKSALALLPHFRAYQTIAQRDHNDNFIQLFNRLREEGIKAEQSMFKATNGVNTHKGANFIFSLLIAAVSINPDLDILKIKETIQKLSQTILDDFKQPESKSLSHGQKLFQKYKVTGIRGEAVNGFPLLFDYPFSQIKNRPYDDYQFLFNCMRILEDTTILHRRGFEGLQWVQEIATQLSYPKIQKDFETINQQFIQHWISPGGSADFLSAAIFLYKAKTF